MFHTQEKNRQTKIGTSQVNILMRRKGCEQQEKDFLNGVSVKFEMVACQSKNCIFSIKTSYINQTMRSITFHLSWELFFAVLKFEKQKTNQIVSIH